MSLQFTKKTKISLLALIALVAILPLYRFGFLGFNKDMDLHFIVLAKTGHFRETVELYNKLPEQQKAGYLHYVAWAIEAAIVFESIKYRTQLQEFLKFTNDHLPPTEDNIKLKKDLEERIEGLRLLGI